MSSRRSRSPLQSPITWVVGLGAIALVVALVMGGGADDDGMTQTADVTVNGDALPLFESATDGALGLAAPTLAGSSFDGSSVSFEPGSPRILMFVAHWCPHCQEELPLITQWVEDGVVPDGVEVAVVSTSATSEAPNYPPSAWVEDVGFAGRVMVDDGNGSAANAFGLPAFPFGVATDGEGRVLARWAGKVSEAEFRAVAELAAAS